MEDQKEHLVDHHLLYLDHLRLVHPDLEWHWFHLRSRPQRQTNQGRHRQYRYHHLHPRFLQKEDQFPSLADLQVSVYSRDRFPQ